LNKLTDTAILQAMFMEATIGMVVVDATGKINYVNTLALEQFGYTRAELVDQPIELLVPKRSGADHAGYRQNYQKDPKPRLMGHGRELKGLRKDGSTFPVEISLSPVNVKGVSLVIAFVHDISERIQRMQRLNLLSESLENVAIPIAWADLNQTITFVNQAFVNLWGYENEEKKMEHFSGSLFPAI